MGKVVKISCGTCGHSWERRIGVGIRHSSLDVIAIEYENETAEKIRMRAESNTSCIYEFMFLPAKCMHCREIVSVPFLTLKENGEIFKGCCPECGGLTEIIDDVEKTGCPVCNSKNLEKDIIGRWD